MMEEVDEEDDMLSAEMGGLDGLSDGDDEGFDFAAPMGGGGLGPDSGSNSGGSSSRRFEDDMDDLLGPLPPPPSGPNRKL